MNYRYTPFIRYGTCSASVAILLIAFICCTTKVLPNSYRYYSSPNDNLVIAFSLTNGKRSNGNKIKSNVPKGFGKKAKNLDELLQTFPTRRPEQTGNSQACPCGVEDISYGHCCYPYHMKLKLPESPKRVLQSRYSAFVYRMIGYIIDTTHPSCRDYRNDKIAWAKDLHSHGMFDSVEFMSLNITRCDEFQRTDSSEEFIDFQVTLHTKEKAQQMVSFSKFEKSTLIQIQERSKFIKDNLTGSWLYASGVVRTLANGLDDIILNP